MKQFKEKISEPSTIGVILVAFLLGYVGMSRIVHATDFPPAIRGNTINAQLLSTGNFTNKTGTGTNVEGVLYHTFQAINSGASNIQFAIDRSLDGTNWIVVSTTAVATASSSDVQMTGKFSWIRVREIGTNSAMVIQYLGGN